MKTAELTGALLDYWVARAEGKDAEMRSYEMSYGRVYYCNVRTITSSRPFSPSSSWDDGGPIIERENIGISPPTSRVHRNGGPNAGWGPSGVWMATTWHKGANGKRAAEWDERSALVAAMRCYVASKFGEDVPDAYTHEAEALGGKGGSE